MEKNTQLPVEVVNGIYMILLNHSHANRTIAAEEIAQYVVEEYATKLHQAEQENAELRRQNEKMKAMATGWRPLLEEVLREDKAFGTVSNPTIKKITKYMYGE